MSSIHLSTTTDCSDAQIVPLSNVLESIIRFTACFTSAVFSINAGPLPAPTPIAGVPDEYADLTIAYPPVARINFVILFFINSWVASMVGIEMQDTAVSGQPTDFNAFLITSTVSRIHFSAPGCGENTILFPPFMEINDLYITVEVGFVDGTIPAITPTAVPTSMVIFSLSSFKIPIVF